MKIIANSNDINDILSNGVLLNINGKETLVKCGTTLYQWTVDYVDDIKDDEIHVNIVPKNVYCIQIRHCSDGQGIDIVTTNGRTYSSENGFYGLVFDVDDGEIVSSQYMKESYPSYHRNNQRIKTINSDDTVELTISYVKQ